MSYNPLQKRGPNGEWIAMGAGIVAGKAAKRRKGKAKAVRAKKGSGGVAQTRAEFRTARGVGLTGLKRNTIPYARANKRSQTIGVNAGTIIPGSRKRVVFGGYVRLENTHGNGIDTVSKKVANRAGVTKNSKVSKIYRKVKSQVGVTTPALRKNVKNAQVRVGTSRRAGPTVIVRRGRHKSSMPSSQRAVNRYDNRMARIAGAKAKTKKPRQARRKATRKKK